MTKRQKRLSATIVCLGLAPAGMDYTRWIVDLWFDESNLLRDANIKIWNISL